MLTDVRLIKALTRPRGSSKGLVTRFRDQSKSFRDSAVFNTLFYSISMYILHTVLCTCLMISTRRICLKVSIFLAGRCFV